MDTVHIFSNSYSPSNVGSLKVLNNDTALSTYLELIKKKTESSQKKVWKSEGINEKLHIFKTAKGFMIVVCTMMFKIF